MENVHVKQSAILFENIALCNDFCLVKISFYISTIIYLFQPFHFHLGAYMEKEVSPKVTTILLPRLIKEILLGQP